MDVKEEMAHELVELLGDDYEAWVGDVDVHYAEVNIISPREMSIGFLNLVSQYGDMRVEGIRHGKVELVVFI